MPEFDEEPLVRLMPAEVRNRFLGLIRHTASMHHMLGPEDIAREDARRLWHPRAACFDVLEPYQNLYQTDFDGYLPIRAARRGSQIQMRQNVPKMANRGAIPTLASKPK
jgi:hypothetical protein